MTAHVQIIHTEQVLASEVRHEEPQAAKGSRVPRQATLHDVQSRHALIILMHKKIAGRRLTRLGPHAFLDLAAAPPTKPH